MAKTLTYTLERTPAAPGRIELHLCADDAVDLRYAEPSSGGGHALAPGSLTAAPEPGAKAEAIVYRKSAVSPDIFRRDYSRSSPGALSATLDQSGSVAIEYADPSLGARYRWQARWSSPALASLLPFELRASGAPLTLPAGLLEQLDALVRHVTRDTLRIDVGQKFSERRVNPGEVQIIDEIVDLDDPSAGDALAPFDEVIYRDAGSVFHRAPALTISLTRSLVTRNGMSTPISPEMLARFDELVARTRLPLFQPYLDRIMRPDSTFISLEVRRGSRGAALSLEYNRAHAHPRFGALFSALRDLAGPT